MIRLTIDDRRSDDDLSVINIHDAVEVVDNAYSGALRDFVQFVNENREVVYEVHAGRIRSVESPGNRNNCTCEEHIA